jgi:hypothetical protein
MTGIWLTLEQLGIDFLRKFKVTVSPEIRQI